MMFILNYVVYIITISHHKRVQCILPVWVNSYVQNVELMTVKFYLLINVAEY